MDIYNSIFTYEDEDSNYVLEISFSDKIMSDILIYELCIDFSNTIYGIFDIINITNYDNKLKNYYIKSNNFNCELSI
jgi:hypothetical protein